MWIEVTTSCFRMTEEGKVKKVTEKLLCDAVSAGDAEAIATKVFEERGELDNDPSVRATKITKIAEIFNIDNDLAKYYLVKVAFITIDEKTGKEKRSVSQILVGAETFKEAYDNFMEGMKGTMADFEIVGISESPIVGIHRPQNAAN